MTFRNDSNKIPLCIIMGNETRSVLHYYDWDKHQSGNMLLANCCQDSDYSNLSIKFLNDPDEDEGGTWLHKGRPLSDYNITFENAKKMKELYKFQIGYRNGQGVTIQHGNSLRSGKGRLYLTLNNVVNNKCGMFVLPSNILKIVNAAVATFNNWSEGIMGANFFKVKIMDTVKHLTGPGKSNVCHLVYSSNTNKKEIITPCGQVYGDDTILLTNWMLPHHLVHALLHFIGFHYDTPCSRLKIPDEPYRNMIPWFILLNILPRDLSTLIRSYMNDTIITSVDEWKSTVRYHITPGLDEEITRKFLESVEPRMKIFPISNNMYRNCQLPSYFCYNNNLSECITCSSVICQDCRDDCHYMHRFKPYNPPSHLEYHCYCHTNHHNTSPRKDPRLKTCIIS